MLRRDIITGVNMEIAIDLGKRKSYVVMENNGRVVKEGYTEMTKDWLSTFFGNVDNPKIIVEASSTINRIANIFEGYDITVAHPAKVKLIAQFLIIAPDKSLPNSRTSCKGQTDCAVGKEN